jgi:hypothetical protein
MTFLRNTAAVYLVAARLYREPSQPVHAAASALISALMIGLTLQMIWAVALSLGGALLVAGCAIKAKVDLSQGFGPAKSIISRAVFAAAVVSVPAGYSIDIDPRAWALAITAIYICIAVWNQVPARVCPPTSASNSLSHEPAGDRALPENVDTEAVRQMRSEIAAQLATMGPTIGVFKDKEIAAFITDVRGNTYVFVGIAPSNHSWRPTAGQTVVSPGLLYEVRPGVL